MLVGIKGYFCIPICDIIISVAAFFRCSSLILTLWTYSNIKWLWYNNKFNLFLFKYSLWIVPLVCHISIVKVATIFKASLNRLLNPEKLAVTIGPAGAATSSSKLQRISSIGYWRRKTACKEIGNRNVMISNIEFQNMATLIIFNMIKILDLYPAPIYRNRLSNNKTRNIFSALIAPKSPMKS